MQTNWKKTTITFIFIDDGDHPVKIALQNAISAPEASQIADFGATLATLTGLTFRTATVSTQSTVA